MKRRQVIKVVFFIIGCLLTVFGIYSLIISWCFFSQLKQWNKTNVFDIKVDLSQPGEYSKKFDIKCPYYPLHDLLLVLPNFQQEEFEKKGSWEGLDANLSVIDHTGAEIDCWKELDVSPMTEINDGEVLLIPFGSLSRNTYTFKIMVTKGAKALSGVEQRLVLTNIIGMAFMGPILYFLVGAPSFCVGVILVFFMMRRKKSKTDSIQGVSI
jgi:hypothetical protein